MSSRYFILTEEYVCVAKVTMRPPLSRFVPKLFGNEKTLKIATSSQMQTADWKWSLQKGSGQKETDVCGLGTVSCCNLPFHVLLLQF